MKYIPKDDVEGINSTPDHPLKEFSILIVGAVALLGVAIYFSGALFGEIAVQMAPRLETFYDKAEFNVKLGENDTLENNPDLDKLFASLHAPLDMSTKSEISILCHEDLNAYALPNKKVWITSTLIDQVKSEKGLAFVLAHELGHIQNKDHLRAFGQSMGLTLVSALFGFAQAGNALLELPTQMSYLGLSRNAETNADTFALARIHEKYGSYAGAEEFFDVALKKDDWGKKIPTVLSTHPNAEKRKAIIQSLIVADEKKTPAVPHNIKHTCKL